jgi:GntR family transcriptional regulator of arabinose operon
MPLASRIRKENISVPRYALLADDIRRQIEAGELSPGDRIPSFTEMRRRHGVSQGTLERAHSILEEEGLIMREVGRGTFITHPAQRSTHGALGFFVNGDTRLSLYWSTLLQGVREAVREHDFQIVFLESSDAGKWCDVDGVLLGTPPNDTGLSKLSSSTPCVSLVHSLQRLDKSWSAATLRKARRVGSVVADEYEGLRQATEHLLELGHTRIGFLTSCPSPYSTSESARMTGYRDALAEAAIEFDERLVRCLREPSANVDYRPSGLEGMRAWLEDDWRELGCTALLAHNDECALGAMEALHEGGYSVPDDISIVGFDGTELCEYSRPRLTSVEVPLAAIAAAGVEMLLSQIAGDVDKPRHITLPTRLRKRDSTIMRVEKK